MNILNVKKLTKDIIRKLVLRDFDVVFLNDNCKFLSLENIIEAVDSHAGILTMPPDESFDLMDIYEVSENEVCIDIDLWFNDFKSDLTLSCRFTFLSQHLFYCIEGIHVL